MKNKIVIFGTGEYAELAHYYFTNDSEYEVVAFTADDEYVNSKTFRNLPLIPFSEILNTYPPNKYSAHVSLSYRKLNKIREEKYLLMKEVGYNLVSYVCSKSFTWPDLQIGDNCFILENQTILCFYVQLQSIRLHHKFLLFLQGLLVCLQKSQQAGRSCRMCLS